MEDLIQVKNLKKYFKTPRGNLHAVDDISFSLGRCKTLGVVGESGCGKSTLGRTVLGLLPATSGEVYLEGTEIHRARGKTRKELRRNMQMIFQDPMSSLDPRMCVRDLIAEPLEIYHEYSSHKERYAKVSELMEIVGLAERFEQSYPHELDGGRRQRIGVARALVVKPKFVVCDEPVSALDVSIQAQILNLLQDLQQSNQLSYMFITHDLSVVKHISDEIMVMYLGCIAEKCASRELFRHPLHPYTKGLLSAVPVASIHRKKERIIMQGELSSPIDPKPGCRFAPRCPYAEERCRCETPQAREILPEHYAACHRVEEINGIS